MDIKKKTEKDKRKAAKAATNVGLQMFAGKAAAKSGEPTCGKRGHRFLRETPVQPAPFPRPPQASPPLFQNVNYSNWIT